MLFSLAYASLSRIPAVSPEMLELARICLARNPRAGLTGALYFDGDQFYQVLEGDEATVSALYRRIRTDPRHAAVQTLWDGPIAARRFGDWAMKFVDGTGRAGRLRPWFVHGRAVRSGRGAQGRLIEALRLA